MTGDRPPDPRLGRTRRAGDPESPRPTVLARSEGDFRPPEPGALLEKRYLLDRVLGRGAFGCVYAARDQLTGEDVAVKCVRPPAGGALGDWRREVATLRRAHFPGVVHLLDDGLLPEFAFIVMRLADGRPFPGVPVPATWESLAEPTASMLGALDRLHWAGFLHRDLKPENVLVDGSGRPTIVDLGIAWDETFDATAAGPRILAGTPAYLAPELLFGRRPGIESDLYSVGVMLFEALTGRPPQPLESVADILRMRTEKDAPPVRSFAPDVPGHVADTVDLMLHRDPDSRPRTAGAVLALLRGDEPPATALHALARLDDGSAVDALLDAARSRRSLHIHGPRRSGRTRALFDAAGILLTEGRAVRRCIPGKEPLWSLRAVLGDSPQPGSAKASLRALLEGGCILIVDDLERLDTQSRALLDEVRACGSVLSASLQSVGDPEIPLAPVPETRLRSLFAGPHRILHIPEDAARALWLRTGGWPGRVVDELDAWIRAGLARSEGGVVVLERAAVERLETDAIPLAPVDDATRTPGDAFGLETDPIAAAIELLDRGRSGQATAALSVALGAARSMRPPDMATIDVIAVRLLQAALATYSGESVEMLLYLLGRLPERSPTIDAVETLARAASAGHHGNAERALRSLAAPLPVENDLLERWRHSIRIVTSQSAGGVALRDALLDLHRWVRRRGSAEGRGLLATWLGWWRYRRLRFRGAVRMHLIAARLAPSPAIRLSCFTDASMAALDGFEFDYAIELGSVCLPLAAAMRSIHGEARAEWVLRSARYRRGDALAPDHELLEAVAALGVPHIEALVLQNESAVAWRIGDRDLARALAARGSRLAAGAGREPVAMLLRTLAVHAGEPLREGEGPELLERVEKCSVPGLAAQGAALLASVLPGERGVLSAIVRRGLEVLPQETHSLRREVLSLDEAWKRVDAIDRAPHQEETR